MRTFLIVDSSPHDGVQGSMKRRYFLLFACGIAAVGLGGCSWWNGLTMRSQSPEERPPEDTHARLISDFASATGMQPAHVEAVGLVTGLHGTGSDPTPSPERAALLEEMQKRDVANPNGLLASGNVSLVMIQGILRPGIQKGDHFDIEVRVPSQSETTSLRGGYLLQTWLTETAMLGNQVRKGEQLASAKGPVMVDPKADPKTNRISMCRGRILGGGVCLKSRPLGLVLTPGAQGRAKQLADRQRHQQAIPHVPGRPQGRHGQGHQRRVHRTEGPSSL